MKKALKMAAAIMIAVLTLGLTAFAADTKYYVAGDFNGYTNPDENYVMQSIGNDIYTLTKNIPASTADPHAYKITNGTWDANGCWGLDTYTHPNPPYTHPMGSILFKTDKAMDITFYFNAKTKAVADSTYYTMLEPYIVGDFFDEAGIGKDWEAEKATMKLIDPGFKNIYSGAYNIPAGSYTFKVTIGKSWNTSYGKDGATSGMNNGIELKLANPSKVSFTFDANTKLAAVKIVSEASPAVKPVDSPKTGDNTPVYIALFLLAGAGLLFTNKAFARK
jgi:hypothetical protein